MTIRVIGLSGPLGCGKDTVANLLVTHVPGTSALAFADTLRAEIVEAYCIEHVYLTRRETKEHPMSALALGRCLDSAFVGRMLLQHRGQDLDLDAPRSPRQIMQWWGTEYRRFEQPGYWVNKTAQQISWLQKTNGARLVVVTDVRFQDEARLVHLMGGQVWQIKRPGCEVAATAHQSEVTGEGFAPAAVINNNHDIRHLQQLVLSAWAEREWRLPGVRVQLPELQEEGAA